MMRCHTMLVPPRSSLSTQSRRGFTLIELVTVIIIIAVLSSIALPMYLDYKNEAMQVADDASIAAIKTALQSTYLKHRVDDAPSSAWVTWAGVIKNTMSTGELPNNIELGITMDGYKLRDQRGNTYSFTPESVSAAATLTKDSSGAPGFS